MEWKESMTQTTTPTLGYQRGCEEEWITNLTWSMIKEHRALKMKVEASIEGTRARFKTLEREKAAEMKRATRRDTRNFYHRKTDQAEEAAGRGDQRELFNLAKEAG